MPTHNDPKIDAGDILGDILIVDDEIANLKLLKELLSREGFQVRPADRPQLAISSALAQPPALILLDVRMPEMDGFEVCKRLKQDERTCDIPIIFISALQDVEDKIRGFEAGLIRKCDLSRLPGKPELDVHVPIFAEHILTGGMQGKNDREVPCLRREVDIRAQIGAITGRDVDIPPDLDVRRVDQAPEFTKNLFGKIFLFNVHWIHPLPLAVEGTQMLLVFRHADHGQRKVEPQPDEKVRVQKDIREQTLVYEIKYRPSSHRDIQQKAYHQTGVVAFAGFDSQ